MTGLLASVRDIPEACLALAGGVDIIDLKEPAAGALGAVSPATLQGVRAALGTRATLSATIGDRPMAPAAIEAAVRTTAPAVDYVKVGFFPGGDWTGSIAALGRAAARGVAIVAVLFADNGAPTPALLQRLAGAGLRGAMLDTAAKGLSLRRHLADGALKDFITRCRRLGLLCGLAGSLARDDVPPLLALAPDYLGFRGALCGGDRCARLDADALAAVRSAIPVPGRVASFTAAPRSRDAQAAGQGSPS